MRYTLPLSADVIHELESVCLYFECLPSSDPRSVDDFSASPVAYGSGQWAMHLWPYL